MSEKTIKEKVTEALAGLPDINSKDVLRQVSALWSSYKPEQRVAVQNSLSDDFIREIIYVASKRLSVDPADEHTTFIVNVGTNGYKSKIQRQWSYKGLLLLAYRNNYVKSAVANDVREADKDGFCLVDGSEPYVKHQIDLFKPRGKVVAYYADIELTTGKHIIKYKTMEEIAEFRATIGRPQPSDTAKAGEKTHSWEKNSVWEKYPDAMARKTVLKAALNLVPREKNEIFDIEDTEDEYVLCANDAEPAPRKNKMDALEKAILETAKTNDVKEEDAKETETEQEIENAGFFE